jgi:hypothetical protein
MTRKHLIKVAKQELAEWQDGRPGGLPRGVALAILFAFIHRATTGETVEETFFRKPEPVCDYEI